MNKKLKFTLLLTLVVLLSTITAKAQSNFGELKAAFKAHTGKVYFFTKDKYYRYDINKQKLEKTAKIQGNWVGLPNNFDAALYNPKNGKYYFFKGDKYYKYNFKTGVEHTGKTGKTGWRGVPTDIDAAVVHNGDPNWVYFFKEDLIYRYSHKSGKVEGSPSRLKNSWKSKQYGIDAAFLDGSQHYYLEGNNYINYISKEEGVIGKDRFKGLSFSKTKALPKSKIKLKVTLTRIKSVQARDSDNIADFLLWQNIEYTANKKPKKAISQEIRFLTKNNSPNNNIIDSGSSPNYKQLHVIEGDENHYIDNSITFEVTVPQEVRDRKATFKIFTMLYEINGDSVFEYMLSGDYPDTKVIASRKHINVPIYDILDYLQHPKALKYSGKKYFNGGYNKKIHESGAFGKVMWFERANNNTLKGTLEFGNNASETYVRFYYRFELVR